MKWELVQGFENYSVSNTGMVRNNKTGRIMKQLNQAKGYHGVNLRSHGKTTKLSTHRLVAIAFLPNPNNYPMVNHKDENKQNNVYTNIEWCTHQYNTEYSFAKLWDFISPTGTKVQIFNLNKFCIGTGLNPSSMRKVHERFKGYKAYKGWTSNKACACA